MKTRRSGHQRLAALDGVRGIAAVIVVLSHALLTTTISDKYVAVLRGTGSDPLAVMIANTPIRYLFMGNEAVVIFFVLSGFVLTLPMLRGRGLDLWAYYPRRVLRLWLPVAASIVLAAVIIVCTSQNPSDAPSAWVKQYSFPSFDPRKVINAMMVITGDPAINNPLWSIKWEMLFSLLLPIAFLISMRITRNYWLLIIAASVICGIGGPANVLAVRYMPMFLAGCIVAKIVHDHSKPAPASRAWLMVFGGAALIALPDVVRVLQIPGPLHAVLYGAVLIGAALVVRGLTITSGITGLFASRPFRFLGRISFSLYLVHVPILIGAIHLVPANPNTILFFSVPIAFAVAVAFTFLVEEPAARLARRVGDASSSLAAKARQGGRSITPTNTSNEH